MADHAGLRGGGERVADLGRGAPAQHGPGYPRLVVVGEGAPQDLEQVGTVWAREAGDVRGVQLGHR
nr:hypothetical protein [Streptomyces sp. 846.5]